MRRGIPRALGDFSLEPTGELSSIDMYNNDVGKESAQNS